MANEEPEPQEPRHAHPSPRERQRGRVGRPTEWPGDFERLYEERFAAFVTLATLLTGSGAAAEEIVQDAFLRCRTALERAEHPAAYVRAAVVNGCRSFHRRNALARRRALDVLPVSAEPELHELADVLALLPTRQRTVLVLRYYADLTEAEIAELLRCRPGTVKSLASRGLANLRTMIEP
jgi:RNA polymerase sigma factor (sigma-70 family)